MWFVVCEFCFTGFVVCIANRGLVCIVLIVGLFDVCHPGGDDSRVDPDDKLKQQQVDATRKENVLVMRLTTKEQEVQEYLVSMMFLYTTVSMGKYSMYAPKLGNSFVLLNLAHQLARSYW